MRNVETTLKQAGLDFRNVVMSHVFLDKPEKLDVADSVYNEFFEDGNEPACATVVVDWIPGGSHVEVTCIATTDLAARKVVRPPGIKYEPIAGSVTASPAVWAGQHALHVRTARPEVSPTGPCRPNLADRSTRWRRTTWRSSTPPGWPSTTSSPATSTSAT